MDYFKLMPQHKQARAAKKIDVYTSRWKARLPQKR